MKILIIADVHNNSCIHKLKRRKDTLKCVKRAIDENPCDLIVFLGDTVHGPDFRFGCGSYEKRQREVYDLTGNTPFATVFGNHDDECKLTKEEILKVVESYPNCVTDGRNYVVKMKGETLLFIDSGSYYDGEGSFYDTVKEETVLWAEEQIKDGEKAILFQHIIMPDIMDYVEKDKAGRDKFKDGVEYTGRIDETPCPPNINTGELETLAPYLKAAVFGHDHMNDFELDIMGVRFIQCAGAGFNSYENERIAEFKIIDTETLETKRYCIK